MAKPRALNGVTLTYPATTAYKQWVWVQIRKNGWTLQAFVDEMKRRARQELIAIGKLETISTATMSDLLGREGEKPPPSNSALLPAINRTLRIAPPPVCDPTDEMQQLVERFRLRWNEASPDIRAILLTALGSRGDDEGGMD